MADELRPQRRGRRIAMTDDERDAFLGAQLTCRVATIGPDGPHATPLWFVWDGASLWLYSIVRSQRWTDLMRDPRIGIVIDAGTDYLELRGIEIAGTVEVVGPVPRVAAAAAGVEVADQADLAAVEATFAAKYVADEQGRMFHDGRHAWLRVTPTKINSWDFRKL